MNKGRPKITRTVEDIPDTEQFNPVGKYGELDMVMLTVDQFEAVKLADYQGLDQLEGAKRMNVSRATFGRIIREARSKIADALVNSKRLRILGGPIKINK